MKQRKEGVAVWRLDDNRYAIGIDQVIRYVGSQEECQRRAEILLPKNTRAVQDRALGAGLSNERYRLSLKEQRNG